MFSLWTNKIKVGGNTPFIKIKKNMEQLITFITVVTLTSVSVIVFANPMLFLISFVGGLGYMVLRGKQKGWSLPNEIKKRHSW